MSRHYNYTDSNGVLRGPHGGVSSLNKNWKGYYGEAAYNAYVKELKDAWVKEQKEIENLKKNMPIKPLAKEGGLYFDHNLISLMSDDQYKRFITTLTEEEKQIYYEELGWMEENELEDEYNSESWDEE